MANWQQTYEQLKKKKKEIDNAESKKEVNKINQKYEIKPNALNESYAPTNKLPLQLPSYAKAPLPTVKKKEEKRTWFNSGAFNDGYDFGDITKTILGTAGDIGTNALKGVASAGEGLAKLIVGGTAEVSDWVGADDFSKKLKNRLAGKDEEFNKRKDKYFVSSNLNKVSDKLDSSSLTGEKLDDLSSSVGNLGGAIAGQSVGIPWYVTMGGSSAGHELENAYTKGASTGEAWGSAVITGASEVLIEKMFSGISFGGKTLDEGIKRSLSNAITNKTAQTLTKFGLDVTGEGIEEVLTEVVQNVGKKLTYEDEKTWKEILASEEALESYLDAFIGGAIMGGGFNAGKLKNSLQTGQDYDTVGENRQETREIQQDIAPVQEQVQQPTNPQETVEDIDNQIAVLEEQLMLTESETEYQKLETQIRELENRANQLEQQSIAPVQMANIEQTNQPTTQEVDSNLPVEVESNTQLMEENQLSDDLVKEIQYKTKKANENKQDVKVVSTNEVTPNSRNGGYRTQEQIDSLTNDIKQNGIVTPIEVKVENGKIEVVNGHHRLKIAKELGIKEIPVKYVNQSMENIDNSQNVLYNNENKESLNYVEGEFESGNRNGSDVNEGNVGVEANEENSVNNNVTLENEGTAREYDKLSSEVQGNNDGPPSTSTSKQNTTPTQEELDNLEHTRKNKSGSEYASAFYDLEKKYGSANLYKGLNNYKSTGKALSEDIAPIRQELAETTKELVKTIKDTTKEVSKLKKELNEVKTSVNEVLEESKALTEADLPMVEQEASENLRAATDDMAPIREDTTPDYEYENDNEGTDSKPIDPLADRTLEEVGSRKVKAYQYEHPEVRPYFQEMAQYMLSDLKNSQKGERYVIGDISQTGGGDYSFSGQKRQTTSDIASLLDSQYNYSYADIEKGLKAIIEDHGAENTAIAKRIEFALNDRLLNGYKDVSGFEIPPNQDYINLLKEKQWNDYYKSIPTNDIAPYETTSEEVSKTPQVKLKTDEDFTPNYEPLLEYMDNLEKRKQERKAIREEAKRVKATLEDTTPFREATKWEQAKLTFKTFFTNNKAVYDEIAKETGNNEIKFKADRINTISGETADITTAQLDNDLNPVGKSLNAIFENAESQGLEKAGQDFLYHLSNINRHKRNKGSANYSSQDSQKFVDDFRKQYPELANQLQTDNRNWNKNRKNNLIDAGFIDTKTAEFFEEIDADYVPFFEDREYIPTYTDVGEIKASQTVKRAKGGSKEVLPIKEAMIKQLMADKRAIAQNDLYKEVMKSYGKKAELGADVRLKATDMSDSLYADSNGDKYLTAYINGERKSVKVSNYMYDNIKLAETWETNIKNAEEHFSFISKPLQAFSSYVRNIHTSWSPSFIITNPLKDIQDAPFNSKDAVKFAKNYKSSYTDVNYAKNVNKYAKEFKELTGQDITSIDSDKNLSSKAKNLYNNYQDGMLWNKFVAGYGSVKMYGDTYSNMDQVITKETQVKNKGKFKKMLEVVPNVNEFMELATRYAEFKTSIENGASLTEAFYNAKDVSTNFGRGGVITKALNRNGATFLNASVQGFSKFVRNFSGENGARGVVGSVAKAVTLGVLPAIFNHLFFGGDEEDEDYKALPDYIKDNYYLIKTDDGEFIRIPKGRALSVFGSAARRTLELAEGEKDAFDGYLDNAMSQSAPNNFLESNVFAPLIQAKNNETWYGGDLVPTRLQDKPVTEQYDESTDEFSKWLGQALNISPYKINYVIDQYTGGLGDLALPYITEEAKNDGSFLAPLKDKFTANSTMDNKYAGQFYDKMDELEVISNGENATEEDQLRSQYMSAVSWEMSALYKEKREVQNDKSLTKAEKYERVKEIQKEINAISKNALETYDTGTFGEYYSSIGDYQFNKYINKNGEEAWGTLYEDEAEDLNSLGLTNEEYNSYFAMKQEFTNLNNEYHNQKDALEETYDKDSDEYDLASDELYWNKKNTIIDSIMNSDFTNEQKAYIYNKYYDSKKNDVITTAGIDMNYLLDYDKNDFTADYNAKGKVIANSRKNKVIEYVNEYDLSIAEKAIIIKSANTFKFDDYNNEIVDYVDKLDIPYEDKAYILKSLDMEVSDDGTISW